MNRIRLKGMLALTAAFFLAVSAGHVEVKASNHMTGAKKTAQTVICIDAGHGGETDGAMYEYYGVTVKEKDINLTIAGKLKEELEQYENVRVVMTRVEDSTMEITPRVEYALLQNADYLISVHNNAAGNEDRGKNGCMVLSTVSRYQAPNAKNADVYGASERLSLAIAGRLQNLGLPLATELGAQVNGVVKRPYSPEGQAKTTRYNPDGSLADYYGLIRSGVSAGLPTIIIEHAYLSNEQDYRNYLSSEEAMEALALADAEGIAEALGLERKEKRPDARSGQLQKVLYTLPWKTIER